MAKKSKRKIVIESRDFFWYVAEDDDALWLDARNTLTIVSNDKKYLVKYPIQQQGDTNLLVVVGSEFGGDEEWGGTWKRIACPCWETDHVITPKIVSEIIHWSMGDKEIIWVDYLGNKQ